MAGRPTKLTPEVQATILEAIRVGAPYRFACTRAGVSEAAFGDWRQKGEQGKEPYCQFLSALKEAEAECVYQRLQNIQLAGLNGQWQADMTLLERRYPTDFGRKDRYEHTGEGGGPVKTEGQQTTRLVLDPEGSLAVAEFLRAVAEKQDANTPEDDA